MSTARQRPPRNGMNAFSDLYLFAFDFVPFVFDVRLNIMLNKIRRVSSSSGSSPSDDGNNVYIETLLYIVHVDEDTSKPMKRTTASFNERHRPTRRPFSFSNPLRRLNSLLKREVNNNNNQDEGEEQPFPPPPLFVDDLMNIQATGPGLTDGFVNEQCQFDLNAPNAELQKLVIAIDGPSKADIQIEVIETGIYRVFYTCQSPGNYHLSLTYDGKHLDGSPYHLRLQSLPSASIQPMEFHVNSSSIVTVRPATPCTVFQAFIQSPEKSINLPITVHKSAKADCYEISFLPPICGHYWLNVSLDHLPIVDNPCRLMVRATKSIVASGQGLFHAYTGESSQFFVSKSPASPTGTFSVGVNGPSSVFLDAHETDHGYEFHYKPARSGQYIISIKNAGEHIQGSPFLLKVEDKLEESQVDSQSLLPTSSQLDLDILRSSMSGDASQVCVFGTGLYEAKPRRKSSFKIDASQAGPGLLLVGLYSSFGPCERLVVKRILPSSPGFIYKVSYQARTRGQYMLVILYGSTMQHVPGSPYLVIVE